MMTRVDAVSWIKLHLPRPVVDGMRTVRSLPQKGWQTALSLLRHIRNDAIFRHMQHTDTKFFWQSLCCNGNRSSLGYYPRENDRDGMHVLFVMEHWVEGNPDYGETNSYHNLINTFAASGVGTASRFHFDDCARHCPGNVDAVFLATVLTLRPDAIVFSPLPTAVENPSPEAFAVLRKRFPVKTISVWFDSVQPHIQSLANRYAPTMDTLVLLDSGVTKESAPRFRERYLPMWTPQDPALYHDTEMQRDIGIAFLGSVACYPDRQHMLALLRQDGLDLYEYGGQRERRLPPEAYAETMRRARMVVNFCKAPGNGAVQFKGRTMETLFSGALLLEQSNPETAKWLKPGAEYIEFRTPEELVAAARYYEAHPEERCRIASAGMQKAQRCYNPVAFWKTVFKHAGLPRQIGS